MSRIVSIPLPNELWDSFYKYGFNYYDVVPFMDILVSLWRSNEDLYGVTTTFIKEGIGLEPLEAQLMIMDGVQHWYSVAEQIRREALAGTLIRWTVMPHVILLELEDEQPI